MWTDRFWLWITILAIIGLVCSCNETQQTPQVWGRGDPPVEWQDMFGNENISRLNFVQTRVMNRNQNLIFGLDEEVDGKPVHKRGLIERVTALESLEERVKRLEEGNGGTATLYVEPNDLSLLWRASSTKPGTHCNEPVGGGCGWNYWQCSLHSHPTDPNQ